MRELFSPDWIKIGCLYLPILALIDLWLWKLPGRRLAAAAFVSFLWTVPAVILSHLIAVAMGFWSFSYNPISIFGIPVELLLGWCVLWGPIPLLLFPRLSVTMVAGITLVFDLVLMPMLAPVLGLGSGWILGELAALFIVLIPAQLIGRWTRDDDHLAVRSLLLFVGFTGWFLFLVPTIIFTEVRFSFDGLFPQPLLLSALYFFLIAWVSVIGLSAMQEFVVVGKGTPLPFDPPKHLVVSGMYRYLRNPMQLSVVLGAFIFGVWIESYWILGIGAMTLIYSVGFARLSEDRDLFDRFAECWKIYRLEVRTWFPSLSPRVREEGIVYFAEGCDLCSDLAAKIRALNPKGIRFAAAERHPSRTFSRVTYELPELGISGEGVVAIARVLEHVNLVWALLGALMRLPGVCWILQLIVDSIGGAPRQVCRVRDSAESQS